MRDINGAGFDPSVEDVPNNLYYCDHQCTSNCRREGCNCSCGEYHNEDNLYEEEESNLD